MAKMRGIKPETFTDDKVLQLSPLARWLFVGMWTLACDNGHVEDNAVQLKVRLLPVDECDVDALLDELLDTGQVVRHDGYLKVDKLAEHQRIDRRYLLLCEWCDHDVYATYSESDRTGTRRAPDVHTAGTRRAPIDEGEGEGEGEGEMKVKVNNLLVEKFTNFWTAFPNERKRAKPDCQKLFTQAVKAGTNPDIIIQAAERYRDDPNREAQYTVNPKTWLREQRWESGPLPARTPTHNTDRFDDWERAAQLAHTQQHQLRAIEGGTR